MNLSYYESENLAILILSFIGGLALSYILKSKGGNSFFTYIIAIVILLIIISSLVKGYSFFIENLTYHLQEYIYFNFIGVIGFVIGIVVGLTFKVKR